MVTTQQQTTALSRVLLPLDSFRLALGRAVLFTDRSNTRPSIACVRVTVADGKLRCTAADGFIAGATVATVEGAATFDVLLHWKEVELLLRALPKKSRRTEYQKVEIALDGDQLRVVSCSGLVMVQTGYQGVGVERFPNLHHVFPTTLPDEGATSIIIDSALLARIARAAALGDDTAWLRFRLDRKNPAAPVVITVHEGGTGYVQFVAAAMPGAYNRPIPSVAEAVAAVLGR